MKLDDIIPPHCYSRAQRLLGEIELVREELGRTKDPRPLPEITGAAPREVYFEALAAWHKADRLCGELGARTQRPGPAAPQLREVKPGHCFALIEGVLGQITDAKQRLGITEAAKEPAVEPERAPSDVLATMIRVNRELSRMLETPFTPTDVYRTVALASAYAQRMGAKVEPAPFERKRQPADCYARLEACLASAGALAAKHGATALKARGTPSDILPTDVYDLAYVVLGEVAFLHALAPNAEPVPAFEPGGQGHRLPSHVHQLARTLEAQLASLR